MADTGLTGAMADAGFKLPSLGSMSWIPFMLVGMIIAAMVVLLIYLWIQGKKFDKNIEVFKKVNGRPVRVQVDKGYFERIGRAGDYWFKTRATKRILPRPTLEISKNTYWFWEREDGEWINFDLEDIDDLQHKANVKYLDEDMRLTRISIEKNLEERLKKVGFWDKYGNTIMLIIFVLMVTIALVVLFSNLSKVTDSLAKLTAQLTELASTLKDIKCSSGSGLLPLNATRL